MWRTPDRFEMAEGPGFEPGLTGPEPVVLPLDDPSAFGNRFIYKIFLMGSRIFSEFAFSTSIPQPSHLLFFNTYHLTRLYSQHTESPSPGAAVRDLCR